VVDFVKICNIYIGKMIIKAAKRIFDSDEICRSYSDLNFGVTFLEHSVWWCFAGELCKTSKAGRNEEKPKKQRFEYHKTKQRRPHNLLETSIKSYSRYREVGAFAVYGKPAQVGCFWNSCPERG